MRYVVGIASPHSRYRVATSFTLGEGGHRTEVTKDDFQAEWKELDVVTKDPKYRTYYGNMLSATLHAPTSRHAPRHTISLSALLRTRHYLCGW